MLVWHRHLHIPECQRQACNAHSGLTWGGDGALKGLATPDHGPVADRLRSNISQNCRPAWCQLHRPFTERPGKTLKQALQLVQHHFD